MENELIVIKQENALEVFTAPKGLDPYIEQIKAEVRAFVPDTSTKKGRDAIASIAHKVAKSKTALDNAGKALVDRLKEQPKLVDAERKRMREELDALKDEVRKPLTEWEEHEESRKAGHEDAIERMKFLTTDSHILDADELRNCIGNIEDLKRDWQQYEAEALRVKEASLTTLRNALAAREKYDAEQLELMRLRAEAADREERERQAQAERDRIAAEEKAKADQAERERVAAENARIAAEQEAARKQAEADAKAKAEIEAAERREREAKEAAERAESARIAAEQKAEADRIAAEQRAEREKQEAIEAERRRVEAEQKRAAEEAEKREANKRHAAKINNLAVSGLMTHANLSQDQAREVVTAIAKGLVANIKISY